MAKRGLYANIHSKRKRIAAGSKEKMRKPGAKGRPTAKQFRRAAKTAKKQFFYLKGSPPNHITRDFLTPLVTGVTLCCKKDANIIA